MSARLACIRYVHQISPSEKDVTGPFEVRETDFADLPGIRKWMKRHGQGNMGRVRSWRIEGNRVLVFPGPTGGMTTHWHCIVITFEAANVQAPTTWADGFGRWHARVSRAAASPLLAARKAIRTALEERDPNVAPHAWRDLQRAEVHDTPETVVYAERVDVDANEVHA